MHVDGSVYGIWLVLVVPGHVDIAATVRGLVNDKGVRYECMEVSDSKG